MIIIFYYGTFSKSVLASCDFKTGDYIDELLMPNIIKDIDIKLNKPRKFILIHFVLSNQNQFIKENLKNSKQLLRLIINLVLVLIKVRYGKMEIGEIILNL